MFTDEEIAKFIAARKYWVLLNCAQNYNTFQAAGMNIPASAIRAANGLPASASDEDYAKKREQIIADTANVENPDEYRAREYPEYFEKK